MSKAIVGDVLSVECAMRVGVVALIVNDRGEVLAGKRVKGRENGTWQFPQGGIEQDHEGDFVKAAIAEVHEEVGMRLLPESVRRDIPSCSTMYWFESPSSKHGWGQVHRWIVLQYNGIAKLSSPIDREFSDVKWMRFEDVITCTADFRRASYEEALIYYKKYIDFA